MREVDSMQRENVKRDFESFKKNLVDPSEKKITMHVIKKGQGFSSRKTRTRMKMHLP